MKIDERIKDYLNDNEVLDEDDTFDDSKDAELIERMLNFIYELDDENLNEDQLNEVIDIIDTIAEEKLDEAISAKKIKISPTERRRRRREYRKKRAQIKMLAKRRRRTTKFKRWKRVSKRKAKQGKTATGKRIRTFIGGRK